jgi:predicted ATPase/signal transduction histidine kinase
MQLLNYQAIEPLHESPISLVCRARRALDGEPVILKWIKAAHTSPEMRARVKREYEVARSLNPGPDPSRRVRGVVETHALEVSADQWVIVQEDFGGESLSRHRLGERLSLVDKLHVAVEATRTLGHLHQRKIVHNDLNPHHIVYNPLTRDVRLIDFGISFSMAEATSSSHVVTSPEGTLPYCAPEQTGRMNRGVDYRADYYSLGVTLYELFTGRLPFESTDPLELIHAHLARQPTPPHEVNPALPVALSRIVLKLMAKNAEDRYQSAFGIESDLREVAARIAAGHTLDEFVPGQSDFPTRFQLPRRLYGRAQEIAQLSAALDRVARGGPSELLLLSGYSGIGKSSLIEELAHPITAHKGTLARGKFEQFQRSIPYSAISRAFSDLVEQILSAGDAARAEWRRAIQAAIEPNGKLVAELIPELSTLLGPQPDVPPLGPSESENRFQLTLIGFASAFCQKDRPLVLFLDDLQWADLASLRFVESLLSASSRGLLLVGAYRDNEVDATHPLALSVGRLERAVAVSRILLAPLGRAPVVELLSDTLREEAADVAPLAALLLEKTRGNPFFITQFLWTLHQERLIALGEDRRWTWDVARIREKDITDNVVDLLLGNLRKLPEVTQDALRLAACVGNRFDLDTLAVVREQDPAHTYAALRPAIADGFVVATSDPQPLSDREGAPRAARHYRFAHDRVQQAAHALIGAALRRRVHLRIGTLLLGALTPAEISERLFEIVDHLNEGASDLEAPEERARVARLDLDAAARAREATAYQAAKDYAERGLSLLPESASAGHPADRPRAVRDDLRFSLKRELAQAEDLMGAHDRALELLDDLLAEAQSVEQEVEVLSSLIRVYTLTGRYEQAILAGRLALGRLGVDLPEDGFEAAFEREAAAIQAELSRQSLAALLARPDATSTEHLAPVRVLVSLNAATMYSSRPLYNLVVALKVRLCLMHGHTPESAFAYVSYGVPLASGGRQFRLAHDLGMMAREVSKKYNRLDLRCKVDFILGTYILPWTKPFSFYDAVYDEGYRAGLQGGDLLFAGNILAFRLLAPFWAGRRLADLLENAPRFLAFTQKTKNRIATDRIFALYLPLLSLTGAGHEGVPAEPELLARFAEHRSTIAVCVYLTTKAQVLHLHGDHEGALRCLDEATPLLSFVAGTMTIVEHCFYTALVCAALCAYRVGEARAALESRVRAAVEQMTRYAEHCPENFRHKVLLMAAEEARVTGRGWEAMSLYDRAIGEAALREVAHVEALACERAGDFWLEQRKEEFARGYLQRALLGYKAWGAQKKVELFEARHGELLTGAMRVTVAGAVSARSTPTTVKFDEALDLATVLKASQAIAEEIKLDSLAKKLVNIVIENAGAERGCLLLAKGADLRIAAESAVSASEIASPDGGASSLSLPTTVIQHVAQRAEDVVLRDAVQEGAFTRDAYIRERKIRSVLCTPLLKQGRLLGILYLENNLVAGAFTQGRLEMLHMLSAQIVVSIENAQIYAEMEDRVRARTQELSDKNAEVSEALRRLRETQEQLVQREKLASLGALTAGIAHELRNPLNFINNFAALTGELVEELHAELGRAAVDNEAIAEPLASIKDNVAKINHHGQRADRIINGMLMHSRARTGTHGPTDLNKLVAESLHLAHHSARARLPGFRIELKSDCDPTLAPIEAEAADLQRVFLNLFDNALHSTREKQKTATNGYLPTIAVTTKNLGTSVEIRVRDNGKGISQANAQKLFTPFFTTKSPGEGVGLGLSICHDVIVRGHRGAIRIDSVEGEHAEFIITLPRR